MPVIQYRITSNGIHPLLLGMSREQIDRITGEEPIIGRTRLRNEQVLRYDEMCARIVMTEDRAVEISVVPPAIVLFEGRSVFDSPLAWRDLVAADGGACEFLGFIVLPRLHLTLTGFHDGANDQLALSSFESGRWDGFKGQMKSFAS